MRNLLTFEHFPRAARRGMVVFAPEVDGDARHIVAEAAVAVPEAGGGILGQQSLRSLGPGRGEAGPLLTAETESLNSWGHFLAKLTIIFDTIVNFFG